jgi:hypothetical protein
MPSVKHAAWLQKFTRPGKQVDLIQRRPQKEAWHDALVRNGLTCARAKAQDSAARDRVHMPSSRTSAWRKPVPARRVLARPRAATRRRLPAAGPPPPLGAGVPCTLANVFEWSAAIGRSSSKVRYLCRGRETERASWVVRDRFVPVGAINYA